MVQPAYKPSATPSVASVRRVSAGGDVSDADLVRRACRGDHWAEEMLYRRHADAMIGLCSRLIRNAADAEDAAQDTFVDAFEQLATLRDPALFHHWLTGIAVHKAHRRLRRRKLLRLLGLCDARQDESLDQHLSSDVSPEVHVEIICLDHALSQLGDKLRIAWQLRYVEGYQLEEVSRHCRCSLATAKRRIALADRHVQKHVMLDEVSHG